MHLVLRHNTTKALFNVERVFNVLWCAETKDNSKLSLYIRYEQDVQCLNELASLSLRVWEEK